SAKRKHGDDKPPRGVPCLPPSRNIGQGKSGASSVNNRKRLRSRFQPNMEYLEERTVPTAGALNPAFNAAGATPGLLTNAYFASDQGSAAAVQPDGKILVAGRASIFGHSHMVVFRYNPNGTLDTTFGDNKDGHEAVVFDGLQDDAANAI